LQAEAATKAGDWPLALEAWRTVNATDQARASSFLAEAKAALALNRAGQAVLVLNRTSALDPSNPTPWRLQLELLRVEDRAVEAQAAGWAAYEAVPPASRWGVLRDLTLALLADLPDDLARQTLAKWATADPRAPDHDARVALLQRFATMPRAGDPDRPSRIAELTALLEHDPRHVAGREALVVALADAGEPDLGRTALDAWPEPLRDARYWRLRGRWDVEYNHEPARAVDEFRRALSDLPHDWKTHFRLARALRTLGRDDEAKQEAETVARLREILDPSTLGPRLAADLAPARATDPRALLDLADLCARSGLTRLAEAWRREADAPRDFRP
jgi:tetratricopeptide (TPR) repeat protein